MLLILPEIVIYSYYEAQKAKVEKLVQVRTFSGFNGWQLANNALNCLPFVKIRPSEFSDPEVRKFAEFIIQNETLLTLKVRPSAKFMWDPEMPLKKYQVIEMKRLNVIYLHEWNYLGSNVYNKFGSYIIKKHPLAFTKYFLLPNLRLLLYPNHDQVMKSFRTDGIPADLLKSWYGFSESEKLYCKSKVFEKTFFIIPVFRLIMWFVLISAIVTFLVKRKRISWEPFQQAAFWMSLVFLLIYSAFSIYAGPFELRYIAPLHLVQLFLLFIIITKTFPSISKTEEKENFSN